MYYLQAEYNAKTDRVLALRIREHKESGNSTCFQHTPDTGHMMDYKKLQVIATAFTELKQSLTKKRILRYLYQYNY